MAIETTVTVKCSEIIKEIVVRKPAVEIVEIIVQEGNCVASVALGRATEEKPAEWAYVSNNWEDQ